MADEGWWRGAILYQIYPRSFADANGDGCGDLGGIVAALPYVASLGVDAVWVSPFFRSPMRDSGYDIADHCDVDPSFGNNDDARTLIRRAHELGLKVLLDMVWAHTSDAHPWFAASRSSRTDPFSDWYVWADPKPDGTPPNNWLSVFGGPAWTWEPRRRQYWLHHFLPSQPALNWRDPAVIEALLAIGRHWLSAGADGFRFDAVDFLDHDPFLRNNPPRQLTETPLRPFGMQEHCHDMMGAATADYLRQVRGLMEDFPGTVAMAELSSAGDPLARAAEYCRADGFHLAYSLGLMRRPATPAALKATIAEVEAKVPGGAFTWALSNHDVERAASRWGDGSPASAAMLLALLLSLRGTVCLYQGDELGLPEADVPFDRLQDPFGIAFWPEFKGRDGCRTPMPWRDDAPAAGFSTAEPWLPIPESHRRLAVSAQDQGGGSVLNTFRRLVRWRGNHRALMVGTLTLVDLHPDAVAFERRYQGETILCVFNPSPAPLALPLPDERQPAEGVGYGVEDGNLLLAGWGAAFFMASFS